MLSGCASGTVSVRDIDKSASGARYETAKLVRQDSTVSVTAEMEGKFEDKFTAKMRQDFPTGDDMTVEYRFIKFDEGDRALRYLVGFGAGKGEMAVEAKFIDANGTHLATVESEGEITMGVFGGSFDDAIENAAAELHEFAVKNFKK